FRKCSLGATQAHKSDSWRFAHRHSQDVVYKKGAGVYSESRFFDLSVRRQGAGLKSVRARCLLVRGRWRFSCWAGDSMKCQDNAAMAMLADRLIAMNVPSESCGPSQCISNCWIGKLKI